VTSINEDSDGWIHFLFLVSRNKQTLAEALFVLLAASLQGWHLGAAPTICPSMGSHLSLHGQLLSQGSPIFPHLGTVFVDQIF
jgi:hypothetical protein